MRNTFLTALLSAFLLANSPELSAQGTGGSITGRMVDASGATLPNARVEIENVETGQRYTATTDGHGNYRLNEVPAGRYRVITTVSSRSAAPTQEIDIETGRTATINLTSPQGPSTDALTTAEAVPVDSTPSSISRNFNSRFVHYLPTPNFIDRNGQAYGAYNLSLLSEGITSGAVGVPGGPAVAGQRPTSNSFHLDGIDNNNKLMAGPLVYLSNEATNEFALFQNQPAPLFGHASGGKFNSIIRTGTNQVHGSVYDYLQNRHLNATDALNRRLGVTENPRYDQNRMGGTIGLPIVPSKIFFFGNFEYIPLRTARNVGTASFAPTAAGFAELSRVPGVSASNLGILRNNVGVVGAAERSAVIGGVNVLLGLLTTTSPARQEQYIGSGALDMTFSERDQLRMRYSHNELEGDFTGYGLAAFQTPRWNRSFVASVAHYHNFGGMATNELRVGYNRVNSQFYPGSNAVPNINIGGDANLTLGPQFGLFSNGIFNTYHLADGVTARLGSHNLRFGADARRYIGSWAGFSSGRGNYAFSSLERFLLDLPPDVTSERAFGGNSFNGNQWLAFAYVTDNWNVTPNFTLDYGMRWQYATIPVGLQAQGLNTAASVPGLIEFNTPREENNNFAPHIGFAWNPGWNKMTVVRGGFGMYFDALNSAPMMFGFSPQLTRVASGNLQSATPGFLANGGLVDPGVAQARAATNTFIGNQRMPYSMQWNLALQQAFWRNGTVEVKYLGSRGVNLPVMGRLGDPNRVNANRSLPLFFNRPTQTELNNLTLSLNDLNNLPAGSFAAAGFTTPLNTLTYDGNSWYHGASVILNHRFTGGFHMMGHYTWSQLVDDSTGTALDLNMPMREKTWSLLDRRHRASATAMFELAPLFRDSFSVARNVFADFNLSGTYTYESPAFLPALSGLNTGLNNNAMGSRAIFNPNGTAGVGSGVTPLTNSRGIVGYLVNDPTAQYIRGAAGLFTSSPRGAIQLRETNNFDVAASKKFNFMERASIELRGEAYNVLNRAQFTGNTINNLGLNSAFGFSAFQTPGSADFGNVDLFPSNNRTLQLALRVVF